MLISSSGICKSSSSEGTLGGGLGAEDAEDIDVGLGEVVVVLDTGCEVVRAREDCCRS